MNHPFKANGSNTADTPAGFEPNSDVLRLQGFRIDKVDKVVKMEIPEPSSWEEEVMAFIRIDKPLVWEQKCTELAQKTYNLTEGIPEAHWRTLCLDRLYTTTSWLAAKTAYSNYRAYLRVESDEEAHDVQNRLLPQAKEELVR